MMKSNDLNVFKLLRIARNLKVKDIAKELSITSSYVHAIESGQKFPSDRLLKDYAAILKVDKEIITSFIPSETFEKTLLSLLQKICEID